jgi:polyhydroxybutyrate depolymerase
MLQIHGTADSIVPYSGGQVRNPFGSKDRGSVLSVDSLASFFVTSNGCIDTPTIETMPDSSRTDRSTITTRTWDSCGTGAVVKFLRIEGGGHTWPGEQTGLPARLVGNTNQDINATNEIWSFFAAVKPMNRT